jgi:uncharacterized protein (DUF305 family)
MGGNDRWMPGMASQDELAELRALAGIAAERRFLELMLAHHEGGVSMAEGLVEESDHPVVTRLAESIMASQANEIELMRGLLAERT